MKILLSICFLLSLCTNLSAQKGTAQLPKKSLENSMFADDDTLTHNDYLLGLERVFQMLNKASALEQPEPVIHEMVSRMNEDDSVISIIKDRLSNKDRALNVRNLQMFYILLGQIKTDTKKYARELNYDDSILDKTKKDIFDLRKDTVVRHIFKDSSLKAFFRPQLLELRGKWFAADTLIKRINILIDNSLAQTSSILITVNELQIQTENLEETAGSKSFKKERRYLWEPRTNPKQLSTPFNRTVDSEKKITQAYFAHTHNQINFLLITGLFFFFWIYSNYRSIVKRNKTNALEVFNFRFIKKRSFHATFIFVLSIAPLFDLNTPVVYIEFIEFLLMIVLTFSLFSLIPKKVYLLWIIFIFLFLLAFCLSYLGLPYYMNRWILFLLNSASFIFGIYAIFVFKKQYKSNKILFFAAGLYTLLNLLAVVCNLFGRVTLMQIFGSAATYAFIQTVALLMFKESVIEALLLQIQTSRVRKEYPEDFDHATVVKGISKMVVICCVIIWIVVFITNLNLFNSIMDVITDFLSVPRIIGSFNFTFGGVILFLAIMWIANFLQKYIAYFFGDIGDDVAFNSKGHRSRLLITRLILLIGGFLLAVAASGLPVDRITVILGALGVGIGLGLQSIVNNFVSGIILIFDRTLRIGDTVEIGDKKGRVKEISVRSSTLLTPDGAEVIIPNGDILSHNIVNWTLSNNNIRIELSFAIDKLVVLEDIRPLVKEILQNSADVLTQKEPEIFINNITSQSTQLKIYFWCKDVTKTDMARSEVYGLFYKKLEEKGIKIL